VNVFVGGGTGYVGRRLIAELLARGHPVTALARPGSEDKLPAGTAVVNGDALQSASYRDAVPRGCTYVHLVGVPRPSPAKAELFRKVDLVSIKEAVATASHAGANHFVYVSVAQPAPVMKAYQQVRAEGEAAIRAAALNATILRPWYVLGPGHWWPLALIPVYKLLESYPRTRDSALRLGLVKLPQMVAALVEAVENPATGIRIVDVPGIRSASLARSAGAGG
jgi:uncharacterized protein YbjT (DUF2867 family)